MSTDPPLRQLFEQCVDQHADSMYRVAFRLTGHRDAATELVQETYLQAWANMHSLRDPAKVRSWMFSILRHQYLKTCRKPKLSSLESAAESIVDQSSLNATARAGQRQAMVQAAVDQLDDDLKLPILLVSMEGMTAEAASEVLGIPRGTVLSRLHRGRQRLKQLIEREHQV